MTTLCLPANQIFKYYLTGKFVAPDEQWKHALFPLHEYELFVMTKGRMYLEYDGEKFCVTEGDYLLLPPSNSFRKGYKADYSCFYWFHFSADLGMLPEKVTALSEIQAPVGTYYTLPQYGKIPRPERLVILMKQLQDMVKERYPISCLNSMATTIISELCGQFSLHINDYNNQFKSQVYQDIVDYIQENIEKNIQIGDIAKEFGYNEKYISHRFTELSGIPLKQFILKQKMEHASFMLTDTNMSILEIAHKLSFSDGHNFCRAFKKVIGLSPSEYRNAYSRRVLVHK